MECWSCGVEFTVNHYDMDEDIDVKFCPFCGSKLNTNLDLDDVTFDEDWNDEEDWT